MKKTAKTETTEAKLQVKGEMRLRPLKLDHASIVIEGYQNSPLVVHAWTHKALQQIRDSEAGLTKRGAKFREPRNPKQDFEESRYRLEDGSDGFPLVSVKNAIVDAAHKSLGIEKTVIRKALFLGMDGYDVIRPEQRNPVIRIQAEPPRMREDIVRVGMAQTTFAYRPEYMPWQMLVRIQFDTELVTAELLLNLIERAGYGSGLGEWRPERGGDWGRFKICA